jgi:hypothetical protein
MCATNPQLLVLEGEWEEMRAAGYYQPPQQGYGAPPTQQYGYGGAPPQQGAYGAPPYQQGYQAGAPCYQAPPLQGRALALLSIFKACFPVGFMHADTACSALHRHGTMLLQPAGELHECILRALHASRAAGYASGYNPPGPLPQAYPPPQQHHQGRMGSLGSAALGAVGGAAVGSLLSHHRHKVCMFLSLPCHASCIPLQPFASRLDTAAMHAHAYVWGRCACMPVMCMCSVPTFLAPCLCRAMAARHSARAGSMGNSSMGSTRISQPGRHNLFAGPCSLLHARQAWCAVGARHASVEDCLP